MSVQEHLLRDILCLVGTQDDRPCDREYHPSVARHQLPEGIQVALLASAHKPSIIGDHAGTVALSRCCYSDYATRAKEDYTNRTWVDHRGRHYRSRP